MECRMNKAFLHVFSASSNLKIIRNRKALFNLRSTHFLHWFLVAKIRIQKPSTSLHIHTIKIIFFFSSDCQAKDIRFVWSFIAEHYISIHQGSIRFQDLLLDNPADRFKVKLSPSSVIYYQGKILFVFIGKFKINQFPNCLKACLISTKREEDVKCTLTLLYQGTVL